MITLCRPACVGTQTEGSPSTPAGCEYSDPRAGFFDTPAANTPLSKTPAQPSAKSKTATAAAQPGANGKPAAAAAAAAEAFIPSVKKGSPPRKSLWGLHGLTPRTAVLGHNGLTRRPHLRRDRMGSPLPTSAPGL